MRKFIVSMLIFALPFILGCEKRLFQFVATIDQTSVFTLSSPDGYYAQTKLVYKDDVLGKLDIPSKAHIISVDIESLSLKVIKRPENQAPGMTVSAFVQELSHTTLNDTLLFREQSVPLAGVDVPYVGLNALIESAVDNLKSRFTGYVQQIDSRPYYLRVSGNSVPAGRQIALDLQLIIKGTIKYEECVETIQGTGGASCEENILSTSP